MTISLSSLFSTLLLVIFSLSDNQSNELSSVKWIHGSANCNTNTDPSIQVFQYNQNTWILRQNKCVNYEAPFMFLFIGDSKALLMDTGATEDSGSFPIYDTVQKLISTWQQQPKTQTKLVVAHTHSHGDHWAGDNQFKGKPNTTVVGLTEASVQQFFGLKDWPAKSNSFDLGNRKVEIIPIPGHDKTSIALYDEQTQLLLTGDTFYPGRLYVRDWTAFKQSIQRLTDFTSTHKITYLLGNHIEMSTKSGVDYPTGTNWQPDEHPLPLTIADLQLLNQTLNALRDQPVRKVFDHFIVVPK